MSSDRLTNNKETVPQFYQTLYKGEIDQALTLYPTSDIEFSSLFPVPRSLKPRTLYLTQVRTAIVIRILIKNGKIVRNQFFENTFGVAIAKQAVEEV